MVGMSIFSENDWFLGDASTGVDVDVDGAGTVGGVSGGVAVEVRFGLGPDSVMSRAQIVHSQW